jgi:hypothetical protein
MILRNDQDLSFGGASLKVVLVQVEIWGSGCANLPNSPGTSPEKEKMAKRM